MNNNINITVNGMKNQFPKGITVDTEGEMDNIEESFETLMYALIVALGLVYFIGAFSGIIIGIIEMLLWY